MEKKKMKLDLKKETIEILNQNEMRSLYGGENTGGSLCNTVLGCSPSYAHCYFTVDCGGGSYERCGTGHLVVELPSPSEQGLCGIVQQSKGCLENLQTQVCYVVETTKKCAIKCDDTLNP